MSSLHRRELIQILAVGMAQQAALAAAYQPRFLNPEEYAMLSRLAEELLPGSKEAKVPFYIDTVLVYSTKLIQEAWRAGLKAAHEDDSPGLIAAMAAGESAPGNELERFFIRLKAMTIEAYCYSEEGQRALGSTSKYRTEFPGCTHPEHQA